MNKTESQQFVIFLVVVYIVYFLVSLRMGRNRATRGKSINHIYLPDILQDNLPNLFRYHRFIDIFIVIFMIVSFSYLYITVNQTIVYKTLIFLAIVFSVKEIFSYVTVLPDASKCCDQKHETNKFFGSCNGLIFSGHTASVLAVVYVLSEYVSRSVSVSLYIATIIYGILIVLVRNHYSIDILVAFVVVDVLFRRVFLKYVR